MIRANSSSATLTESSTTPGFPGSKLLHLIAATLWGRVLVQAEAWAELSGRFCEARQEPVPWDHEQLLERMGRSIESFRLCWLNVLNISAKSLFHSSTLS